MAEERESVTIRCGEAAAVVALEGAEPLSWRIAGRELLWHGDQAHWNRSAPILFPVVGASAGGVVRVAGRAYPMPQHGFARDSLFAVTELRPDAVRLRLTESPASREHYPFAFALDVTVSLEPAALSLAFEVRNPGSEPLPYALGVHPAFPWPFAARERDGHSVVFEAPEAAQVPLLTGDGLLRRRTRRVEVDGTRLPLTPEPFEQGALVFLDAASRSVDFLAPSGARITLAAADFPHLALWTKPTAPFLSMEAWTGHADWEDADGELAERSSIRLLAPGAMARHAAVMRYTLPAVSRRR
jgi:galactose mutarotase-like enzyme